MNIYLITIEDLRTHTKNIARTVVWDDVEPYIREAQNLDIKPKIGDETLMKLLSEENEVYTLLLNGGIYTNNGQSRMFSGLKAALSYYIYARLVNNSFQFTRFGSVQKTDQYSQNTENVQRKTLKLDAVTTADAYLYECVQFIKAHPDTFPDTNACITKKLNRTFITVIKS